MPLNHDSAGKNDEKDEVGIQGIEIPLVDLSLIFLFVYQRLRAITTGLSGRSASSIHDNVGAPAHTIVVASGKTVVSRLVSLSGSSTGVHSEVLVLDSSLAGKTIELVGRILLHIHLRCVVGHGCLRNLCLGNRLLLRHVYGEIGSSVRTRTLWLKIHALVHSCVGTLLRHDTRISESIRLIFHHD